MCPRSRPAARAISNTVILRLPITSPRKSTACCTPGHTKGTTTWTMKAKEGDKTYTVVIIGSPNVNAGYKLVNNALYPQIASDYERMFRILKSLPCDVFLGAHGNYYGMEAKYARMKEGAANTGTPRN